MKDLQDFEIINNNNKFWKVAEQANYLSHRGYQLKSKTK